MHASVTMYNVTAVFVHFMFEFSQAVRSVILYTVANVFSVRNVIQAACKYMDNCICTYIYTHIYIYVYRTNRIQRHRGYGRLHQWK